MSVIVKSHHVEITSALKEYADKKIEKLNQFFEPIISMEVNLTVEATSAESDRQVASAIIQTNAGTFTAKEHSADMYSSIDLLYEKLRRQLKKAKEKQKHHKGHVSADGHELLQQQRSEQKDSSNQEEKQRYIPKPMGEEDAATILNEENLNFLVFRDLKEHVCVIYKRENGSLDIIRT